MSRVTAAVLVMCGMSAALLGLTFFRSSPGHVCTVGPALTNSGPLAVKADPVKEADLVSYDLGNGYVAKLANPEGWTSQQSSGSSRDEVKLGHWKGSFLGDKGTIYLTQLARSPDSVDDYAARQASMEGLMTADKTLVRAWAVLDGNWTHIQLYKEQRITASEPEAYWLRYIKIEKAGDQACAVSLYLRLGANPGGYEHFKNSRRVSGHLKILESFKVEKVEKK